MSEYPMPNGGYADTARSRRLHSPPCPLYRIKKILSTPFRPTSPKGAFFAFSRVSSCLSLALLRAPLRNRRYFSFLPPGCRKKRRRNRPKKRRFNRPKDIDLSSALWYTTNTSPLRCFAGKGLLSRAGRSARAVSSRTVCPSNPSPGSFRGLSSYGGVLYVL